MTSERDGEVVAVDTATLSVLAHIPTGPRPRSIVFARDGVTAFVTNELGASVTVLDTAAQTPIDTIKLTSDSPVPVAPRPMGEVLSPDGRLLYVSTGRGGSVAIIDIASRKQVRFLSTALAAAPGVSA